MKHLPNINSVDRGITVRGDETMKGLASPSSAETNASDERTDVKSSDKSGLLIHRDFTPPLPGFM